MTQTADAADAALSAAPPDAPLFERLLGEDFKTLPTAVQAFHHTALPHRFEGRAQVTAARGRIARCIAFLLGLPRIDGEIPIAVTIEPCGNGERWIRHFPPRPMRSTLQAERGELRERLGPVTLRFRVHADAQGTRWELRSVRLLGLPLPLSAFRGVQAREHAHDGHYRFLAAAALPLIGLLVRYEGWLDVDG